MSIRWLPATGLILMVVATVESYLVRDRVGNLEVSPGRIEALKNRLDGLPRELGDGEYAPFPYEIDPEVVKRSGADTFAARGYRGRDGGVYRVYLGGAIRNRESFHAPNVCMPAAGWEILSERSVASPMGAGGGKLRRLDLRHGEARMLVYYWFQCGDRQTDHDLVARWYRFLDYVGGPLGLSDAQPFQPTMIATIYVPFVGTADGAERRAFDFMRTIGPSLLAAIHPKEN